MEQRCGDLLDDDCWELVFKKLTENHHDIASLSSVCKTFLSITNGMKSSLRTENLSYNQFARLLQRFSQLKSVDIGKNPHISRFGPEPGYLGIPFVTSLHINGFFQCLGMEMKAIKKLNGFQGLGMEMKAVKKLTVTAQLCDDDLISLADIFPCIEELKITSVGGKSITDDGMEVLALKLKGLVKISLMYCKEITDKSLILLSSNCLNLTDIRIAKCPRLTENGIGFIIRHSSMLTSFSLNFWGTSLSNGEHQFTIKDSISYARKLEEINIFGMEISDAVICSIASLSRSSRLLKRVNFTPRSGEDNFTILGLNMLVMAHPNLEHFRPGVKWITDQSMIEISQHLQSLTCINLDGNKRLSCSTFFMLTKTCPFLEAIYMNFTRVGTCDHLLSWLHTNYRVKFLSICSCKFMNDSVLKIFGSVCPNIETLLAKDCPLLTDDGISEIVRICPKMRRLDVSKLNVTNFLGTNDNDGTLKLQAIFAWKTKIDDECMILIGMRCPDLEELDIKDCQGVTSHGVEEVVKNCKKIKKINMGRCRCVSIELLEWMVNSRPSLEHIVISPKYALHGERNDLFLRNGCPILKYLSYY